MALPYAWLSSTASPERRRHRGNMALSAAQQKAQENRNTIFVEDGEIVRVEAFAGDQFIMRIRAPKCAADAEPGSFVHLTCDESLPMRRPLSIMRTDGDCLDVLYKIVGEGLRLLSHRTPGDTVSVMMEQSMQTALIRSYFGTKILGYSYKTVGIPDDVNIGNDVLAFDPAQMRAAFDAGRALAKQRDPWKRTPPNAGDIPSWALKSLIAN